MAIPLILASKSLPRRNVLNAAGVCPTIRVSHVDEPAALRDAAAKAGVNVGELSIGDRVAILAEAKAQAVYQAYRNVAATADAASGECVVGYPLKAAGRSETDDAVERGTTEPGKPIDYSTAHIATTRDFSGVNIPTRTQPINVFTAGRPGLVHSTVGPLILGCDSMFLMDGECYGKPHSVEAARERLKHMSGATGELWTGHCLVDFATGRVVRDASHAVVHFSEFSGDDIERYIATGEPLEVAGSFTLEGFGGAFIDGIEGDPSGIIGLSLPLVRRLTERLGIAWPDLWNVRSELAPTESKAEGAGHAGIEPPKENVHQPGAAVWSAEGGTWGIPGGATAQGETPIEGALRESYEEANITPEDIDVVGSYCEDHGPWAYTTVFAFEKPGHTVEPKANDDESMEIAWVPIEQVGGLKLLTAMRTDWPRFAARLNALAATYR